MRTACLRIANLTRIYRMGEQRRLALYAPNLEIPYGEVVFLLGVSGCGKTTMLETLGLLSRADDESLSRSRITFYAPGKNATFHYTRLWKDARLLSAVRSRYLSFMFQQANMLPIYKVIENVALTPLIQGEGHKDARVAGIGQLAKVFARFESNGASGKFPYQLSGGQQQRASFARASAKDFNLFLADEPTGNLGQGDAHKVMGLIRSTVKEAKNDSKTAVVVSHDLRLGLYYADRIIIINRNGVVSTNNVYAAQSLPGGGVSGSTVPSQLEIDEAIVRKWSGVVGCAPDVDSIKKVLDREMESAGDVPAAFMVDEDGFFSDADPGLTRGCSEDAIDDESHSAPCENMSPPRIWPFARWFLRHRVIAMLGSRHMIFLTGLLLVVFLAMGMGRGGLTMLEKKMRDPFVRCVDMELPAGVDDRSLGMLEESLLSATLQAKYNVTGVATYTNPLFIAQNEASGSQILAEGRTLEVGDPLMMRITEPENLVWGRAWNDSLARGVIITQDYATRVSPDGKPLFLNLFAEVREGEMLFVKVPVRAVVKDLPARVDLLCTPFLEQQFFYGRDVMPPEVSTRLLLFLPVDEDQAWAAYDRINEILRSDTYPDGARVPLGNVGDPVTYTQSAVDGYTIRVQLSEGRPLAYRSALAGLLLADPLLSALGCESVTDMRMDYNAAHPTPVGVSMYLSDLESIRELAGFLLREYRIEVDMTRVEATENYHAVAGLTNNLALALIVIAAIAIAIYLTNVLTEYLHNDRVYLGMFLAFGLYGRWLVPIFAVLMVCVLAVSLLLSAAMAVLLADSGLVSAMRPEIAPMMEHFTIEGGWMRAFVASLLVLVISTIVVSARAFLRNDPGDLIYGRSAGYSLLSVPRDGIWRRLFRRR